MKMISKVLGKLILCMLNFNKVKIRLFFFFFFNKHIFLILSHKHNMLLYSLEASCSDTSNEYLQLIVEK